MPKHITLIGMMGSGKSTVAPLIAAPLKRPVLEVDQLTDSERDTGSHGNSNSATR